MNYNILPSNVINYLLIFSSKKRCKKYIFIYSSRCFCLFLLCSGLCTIFRSEAGGQTERFDEEDVDKTRNYHNNAHWLKDDNDSTDGGGGQPSNFVAYYDATSLYPSSGEQNKLQLFFCYKNI